MQTGVHTAVAIVDPAHIEAEDLSGNTDGVYEHEECPQGIYRAVTTCTAPSACHATQCILFLAISSSMALVLVMVVHQ